MPATAKEDKVGKKTAAQAAIDAGLKVHFIVRSVLRTMNTMSDGVAITGAEFDAYLTEWIDAGWELKTVEVVAENESVYNVAAVMARS